MADKTCIVDDIKALPNYKERRIVVGVMMKKNLIDNYGSLEEPIFLIKPNVCEKHPRGCSFGSVT